MEEPRERRHIRIWPHVAACAPRKPGRARKFPLVQYRGRCGSACHQHDRELS